MTFLHPVCHSCEGGNPEDLQSKVLPRLIEKLQRNPIKRGEFELKDNTLTILIGGEAGQGLVTLGQLLAKSLVRSGYSIIVTQSYQSRIRGGHNTFALTVSVDEIHAPREKVDILIAFDRDTVSLHREHLSSQGLIILDEALDVQGDLLVRVPFRELAKERFSNIVALGVVGSLLGLEEGLMARTVDDFFGKKDRTSGEENRRALSTAIGWSASYAKSDHKLPPLTDPPHRLMMNGNEAIALGAVSAGLRFYS